MKKLIAMLCMVAMFAGCGKQSYELAAGPTGAAGTSGANGHSLVSQYVTADEAACPNGGTELDIYLDTDDSLTVSATDIYQGSMIACNGSNGLNGTNGLNGIGQIGPQGEPGVGIPGPQGVPGVGIPGPQGRLAVE
ncbi:MAG: hypothetical protein ACREGB_00660 [Candidatus Saccharimonadales bacterium]